MMWHVIEHTRSKSVWEEVVPEARVSRPTSSGTDTASDLCWVEVRET